ncbi:MAG: hypothetical protein JNL09_06395 [Anaerolineales bacterium]|nr:hypothetical protein [Anaerolineales bacterium]
MWLNQISAFFARYKGLLVLVGIALVLLNWVLRMLGLEWLTPQDLLLHLGVVLGLFGMLLAVALG